MSTPKKKVTVASLADELGLSTCTVSKILNRSFDGFTYAPDTIKKVEKAAKRHNYIPNIHARSLRTKKSMTVGLVVPCGMPYFSGTLVEKISQELRPLGYETIVGHSSEDITQEAKLIRTIISKSVDGLLWLPYRKFFTPQEIGIDKKFPLVLLNRTGCSDLFPAVVTDNERASEELAFRIKAEGHEAITMITSSEANDTVKEREAGIRKIFGRNITLLRVKNDTAAAKTAVNDITITQKGASLICLTQDLALGAMSALIDKGLKLGTDISFASFDDLPYCEIWQPSITRIQQNVSLLANEAVRLIIQKLKYPLSKQPLEVRIPASLVWGSSVVCLTSQTKTEPNNSSGHLPNMTDLAFIN